MAERTVQDYAPAVIRSYLSNLGFTVGVISRLVGGGYRVHVTSLRPVTPTRPPRHFPPFDLKVKVVKGILCLDQPALQAAGFDVRKLLSQACGQTLRAGRVADFLRVSETDLNVLHNALAAVSACADNAQPKLAEIRGKVVAILEILFGRSGLAQGTVAGFVAANPASQVGRAVMGATGSRSFSRRRALNSNVRSNTIITADSAELTDSDEVGDPGAGSYQLPGSHRDCGVNVRNAEIAWRKAEQIAKYLDRVSAGLDCMKSYVSQRDVRGELEDHDRTAIRNDVIRIRDEAASQADALTGFREDILYFLAAYTDCRDRWLLRSLHQADALARL